MNFRVYIYQPITSSVICLLFILLISLSYIGSMSLYLPRVFVFIVMWLWGDQELLTKKSIFFMCQTRSANKPDCDSDLLISPSLKTIWYIKRKLYLCAEGRRGSVWPIFIFFHKQSVNSTIKLIPSPMWGYDSPSMQEKWEPEPVKLIWDLRVEERQQATDIIHAVHLEEDMTKSKLTSHQQMQKQSSIVGSHCFTTRRALLTWEQRVASSWK